MAGIAAAGLAGISKDRVMSPEQQKTAIKEFNLKKGVGVAVLSGVMSACFAYGLVAGDPVKTLTMKHGTPVLWQGLPVLVVVLIGGFLTNFVWCLVLLTRNKTGYQYFSSHFRDSQHDEDNETIIATALEAPSREVVEHMPSAGRGGLHAVQVLVEDIRLPKVHERKRVPILANYLLCALAGHYLVLPILFLHNG